jgi:hypothetical protein
MPGEKECLQHSRAKYFVLLFIFFLTRQGIVPDDNKLISFDIRDHTERFFPFSVTHEIPTPRVFHLRIKMKAHQVARGRQDEDSPRKNNDNAKFRNTYSANTKVA